MGGSFAELGRTFAGEAELSRDAGLSVVLHVEGVGFGREWAVRAWEGVVTRELGSLVVRRAGGEVVYQAVEVEGRDEAAIDRLLELCHEAGAMLGDRERERVGVAADVGPVLRWLAFVVHVLRGVEPRLVSRTEHQTFASERIVRDTIRRPLLASARAIERAGLAPPPQPPRAAPPRQPAQVETPESRKVERQKRISAAMFLVRDHPEWSDRRIAGEAGVSPSTLSRNREYRAMAGMARGERRNLPRGYRNAQTGEFEAWEDED